MIGSSGRSPRNCRRKAMPGASGCFSAGAAREKRRAGAEWVSRRARLGQAGRIALIGPTFHDVREVMVEGRVRPALACRTSARSMKRRAGVWSGPMARRRMLFGGRS